MATQYISVKNLNQLHSLKNHEPGEIAYLTDTKEFMVWHEEKGWTKMEIDNKGISLNLYDLNKNIVGQLTPLAPDEITMKMGIIKEYYNKSHNTFHMLLCRDFNYYTIFNYDSMLSFPDFPSAVCTIITELGDVYSIDLLEDGAMEIWIKPTEEESPYAFYLFPYDAGVVYYG